MTFDSSIKHTAEKDNYIADALSRMNKYPHVSTTEDDFIPHSVDSTTAKPLQEIPSNYINLSDHCIISCPTSNHLYHSTPSRGVPISIMSTVTLISAEAEPTSPDTTTDAHI